MAPPLELFPASELPDHLQTVPKNFEPKRRKGEPLDPFTCPLHELEQFSCQPAPGRKVRCVTILRLFRKCENGVTVETTALKREQENYIKLGPNSIETAQSTTSGTGRK